MTDRGYIRLDTAAFDAAIAMKTRLIQDYNTINDEYDAIVSKLKENWKGEGADAFFKDARIVKSNLVGLFDMVKMMCDTLEDCKEIFTECDTSLGEYNRNPDIK